LFDFHLTALFQIGKAYGNPINVVPFNDYVDLGLSQWTPFIGVEVFWLPEYLYALRFIYGEQNSSIPKIYHGDSNLKDPAYFNEMFMLMNGERINKVTSYFGRNLWQFDGKLIPFVLGIRFQTTSGRTSQLYGSSKGDEYTESFDGFTFGYAKGRSVTLIDQLQIEWKNQGI